MSEGTEGHRYMRGVALSKWSQGDSNPWPPPCKGATVETSGLTQCRDTDLPVMRFAVLPTDGAREVGFELAAAS
jgi:hypothetical protein